MLCVPCDYSVLIIS
jgi:hypothetical protein